MIMKELPFLPKDEVTLDQFNAWKINLVEYFEQDEETRQFLAGGHYCTWTPLAETGQRIQQLHPKDPGKNGLDKDSKEESEESRRLISLRNLQLSEFLRIISQFSNNSGCDAICDYSTSFELVMQFFMEYHKIDQKPCSILELCRFRLSDDKASSMYTFYLNFRTLICQNLRKKGDRVMYPDCMELLEDERISTTFEEVIVLWCLEKIDPRLPVLVGKCFRDRLVAGDTLKDLESEIFNNISILQKLEFDNMEENEVEVSGDEEIDCEPLNEKNNLISMNRGADSKDVLHKICRNKKSNMNVMNSTFLNEAFLKCKASDLVINEYNKTEVGTVGVEKFDKELTKVKKQKKLHVDNLDESESSLNNKFTCNECDASFKNQRQLISHLKTHLNPDVGKDFDCKIHNVSSDFIQREQPYVNVTKENPSSGKKDRTANDEDLDTTVCKLEIIDDTGADDDKLHDSEEFSLKTSIDKSAASSSCKKSAAINNCNKLAVSSSCIKSTVSSSCKKLAVSSSCNICQDCGKQFAHTKSLIIHRKRKICLKDDKVYSCEVCGKCFTHSGHLSVHSRVHSVKSDQSTKCALCGKMVADQDKHRLECRGEKFICSDCGKEYANKSSLRNHIKKHKFSEPGKTWTCEICGKNFNHQQNLSAHLKIHRDTAQKKVLRCETCRRRFYHEREMGLHVCKHHSCETCSAKFLKHKNLVNHRKWHDGQTVFPCGQCEGIYMNRKMLNAHKRTAHKAHTKKYACDECPKAFMSTKSLYYHKLVHSGEKPYKCQECGAAFRQKAARDGHYKIHTNEKPFPCSGCDLQFKTLGQVKKHREVNMCGFKKEDLFRTQISSSENTNPS